MKFIFLFLLSWNASAIAQDSCDQILSFQFPRSWRIDQKLVGQYLEDHPEQQSQYQKYFKLAAFIEDPQYTEMFSWLGSQYFLSVTGQVDEWSDESFEQLAQAGATSARLNGHDFDKAEFIRASKDQINLKTEEMEKRGFFGVRYFTEGPGRTVLTNLGLNARHFSYQDRIPQGSLRAFLTISQLLNSREPEIHVSMEGLDGLFEEFFALLSPAQFDRTFIGLKIPTQVDDRVTSKFKSILKSMGRSLPTLAQLMLHCGSARMPVIQMIANYLHVELSAPEGLNIISLSHDILLKKNPIIPKKFKEIIAILNSEFEKEDAIFDLIGNPNLNMKERREYKERSRINILNGILYIRFLSLLKSGEGGLDSLDLATVMSSHSQNNITIDQGLEPVLQRILIELYIGRRVLSARDYQSLLKTRLKEKISAELLPFLRDSKSSRQPVNTVPPLVPQTQLTTRQDRLDQYIKTETQTAPSISATQEPSQIFTQIESKPDLYSKLLDSPSTLAQARERLIQMVKPDKTIAITTKRFGFVYRVSFSKRALDELAFPKPGLPQDFRPWLQAMRMGPARDQAQNGWKRMSASEWKIKLITSPYRLYGYRDGQGLFHFTHFELAH